MHRWAEKDGTYDEMVEQRAKPVLQMNGE